MLLVQKTDGSIVRKTISLNASDVQPFRDLGNITAIGVAVAFVLSLTLLPALLMYLT